MLKTDLHIHTIASGHAYSTILESVTYASNFGLETIAITDHGPSMEGAPHLGYFDNMTVIPKIICGVNIFMGCEANVLDIDGKIDLTKDVIEKLDIVLAGLHQKTPYSHRSVKDNTKALIETVKNNAVHIISHPYRIAFPVDIIELVKVAYNEGSLLELNLSLLRRFGRNPQLFNQINTMIENVEKIGTKIVVSSDAHIATSIGDDSILSELDIKLPNDLVLGHKNGYNEIREFLTSRR